MRKRIVTIILMSLGLVITLNPYPAQAAPPPLPAPAPAPTPAPTTPPAAQPQANAQTSDNPLLLDFGASWTIAANAALEVTGVYAEFYSPTGAFLRTASSLPSAGPDDQDAVAAAANPTFEAMTRLSADQQMVVDRFTVEMEGILTKQGCTKTPDTAKIAAAQAKIAELQGQRAAETKQNKLDKIDERIRAQQAIIDSNPTVWSCKVEYVNAFVALASDAYNATPPADQVHATPYVVEMNAQAQNPDASVRFLFASAVIENLPPDVRKRIQDMQKGDLHGAERITDMSVLQPGMRVTAVRPDSSITGEIISRDDAAGTVTIRDDNGVDHIIPIAGTVFFGHGKAGGGAGGPTDGLKVGGEVMLMTLLDGRRYEDANGRATHRNPTIMVPIGLSLGYQFPNVPVAIEGAGGVLIYAGGGDIPRIDRRENYAPDGRVTCYFRGAAGYSGRITDRFALRVMANGMGTCDGGGYGYVSIEPTGVLKNVEIGGLIAGGGGKAGKLMGDNQSTAGYTAENPAGGLLIVGLQVKGTVYRKGTGRIKPAKVKGKRGKRGKRGQAQAAATTPTPAPTP